MLKIKLAKINKILVIKGKINPKMKAIKPNMMRISNRGIMIKLANRELRDKLVKYQIIIGKQGFEHSWLKLDYLLIVEAILIYLN